MIGSSSVSEPSPSPPPFMDFAGESIADVLGGGEGEGDLVFGLGPALACSDGLGRDGPAEGDLVGASLTSDFAELRLL